MAEEQKEPQQVTTKEPQQVTTKNPKKVEAGKRLAVHGHRKREEVQAEKGEVNQYYGIGVVIAVGVIGGLDYYIYQTKKRESPSQPQPPQFPQQPRPQTNKFEMDWYILGLIKWTRRV